MKKLIYIMIFFILISSVYAEKITIFNFHHDYGTITLKEQIIKEGYYPDRNTLPYEKGHSCELIDQNNKKLYSFEFELPVKLYTDVIQYGKTSGNVVVLSETDFSFAMPYFPETTNIKCYNQRGYEIINQPVEKIPLLSPEKKMNWLWWYLALSILGLVILIFRKKKH